jgi:hypothetical protein
LKKKKKKYQCASGFAMNPVPVNVIVVISPFDVPMGLTPVRVCPKAAPSKRETKKRKDIIGCV